MVSLFATAAMAVGLLTGSSSTQPLQWEASYGKALEATKTEEHPLLVVLDKPATTDARVAPELLATGTTEGKEADLLRPYHLCHVDVTTEYGQRVAQAFKAKSFPYVAVIDKTGSVIIYSKEGKIASDEWSRVLSVYKTGDRAAISRVTFKPNSSNGTINAGYCPTCQQRSF